VRSAAKNHASVAIVTDTAQYAEIIAQVPTP
jgi:AICAR transformylase/IMP cyclohydrolase PurH